jgi:hypothetical protein
MHTWSLTAIGEATSVNKLIIDRRVILHPIRRKTSGVIQELFRSSKADKKIILKEAVMFRHRPSESISNRSRAEEAKR